MMAMREEQKNVALNAYEEGAVIAALNKLRTEQLEADQPADFVSEIMLKIIQTPSKRARVRDETR